MTEIDLYSRSLALISFREFVLSVQEKMCAKSLRSDTIVI